jgi:hypothetical protein
MSLPRSLIPVQFVGGLDQRKPEKGVMPGKFIRLENCVRRKMSLIEKRFGVTALSDAVFGTSTAITEGVHLGNFNDDVFLIGNDKLYSYSEARDSWIDKGSCTTTHITNSPFVRNSGTQALYDVDSSDGMTVAAWEDSAGGVYYSVVDDSTGANLVYSTVVDASGSRPKVIALRDSFLLGYIVGAALKVRVITKAAPTTLGAAANIKGSAVDPAKYWDLDLYQGNYAVYAVSTTTPSIEVGYVDHNGVVGSPVTNTLPAPIVVGSAAATDFCSIVGDAENSLIWLFHGDATVDVDVITSDLITTDNETVQAVTARNGTGVVRSADNKFLVFYEIAAASVKDHFVRTAALSYTVGGSLTVSTAASTLRKSVGLASKAFEDGTNQFVLVAHESTLQPTYFLTRQDGFIAARIAGNIGGGLTRDSGDTLKSGLPRIQVTDDGAYTTLVQIRNRLEIESGGATLKSNKGLNKIALEFGAAINTDELGLNEHIAGGLIFAYDGVSVFEHGFFIFPEDLTKAAAAGGSLPAGDYSFRVIYEWTDARGQIHRSAPSIAITQTATLNQKITLTVPTLRVTDRTASSVKIVVYMAAIGLATVFYRKSETANTTATDTVAIEVATSADTTKEILYTTGGVLDNICPPAAKVVHEFKNRLWLGGTETGDIWYSKEFVTGEAVAFSDSLIMPMESDGGEIRAYATMDGADIIFKQDRIYYLTGEGPLDTGAQNDYGRPQLIASDVGTSIPNSVVEGPFGVAFKSDKGFYILTRRFQLKAVGDPVFDFNDLTVTSGTLHSIDNEVRWTTEEGTTLVYNYDFDQWSVFTNCPAIASCNGLGTYLRLQSDGTVQREVPDQFNDNNTRYSMAIETSWFAFAGIQGFQRIYELQLLGDFVSHHYTKLKVAYDYEEAYNQIVYFDTRSGLVSDSVYGEGTLYGDSEVYGGDGSEVYQFRFAPQRQKCESMKLRIEDIDTITSNGGGSVKFMVLTFDVGRKAGPYRLGAVKSIGG